MRAIPELTEFADSAELTSIRYSIGADKVNPYYEYRGAVNFAAATASLNLVITRNLVNSGNRLGIVQSLLTKNNGVYSLEVFVQADSTDYFGVSPQPETDVLIPGPMIRLLIHCHHQEHTLQSAACISTGYIAIDYYRY